MNEPLISIVVLTHNRNKDLIECLSSLTKLNYSNYEVIVVDNGCTDGTGELVSDLFPKFKLIRSDENLGAAGGRNLGFRFAQGEYIFFIDDDVIVDENILKAFISAMKSDPSICIAGAKLYHYNGRLRIMAIGCDVNLITGRTTVLGSNQLDVGQFDKIMEVPMIGANCLFVKREVFDKLGGFDEAFFIPYEDCDFCARARRNGYRIYYVPQAKMWVKPSTGFENPQRVFYMGRNKVLFMRKNAHPSYFAAFLMIFLPLYVLLYLAIAMQLRKFEIFIKYLNGIIKGIIDSILITKN